MGQDMTWAVFQRAAFCIDLYTMPGFILVLLCGRQNIFLTFFSDRTGADRQDI